MPGKPIVNVTEAPTHSGSNGEHFAYSMTQLAAPAGARAIGANITRVPPGKAAFPIHHHHANEEHFFILSGRGVVRIGKDSYDVKPQDYIVNVPGGAQHAHQLVNTGDEDLVYLALSTTIVPEVVGYPDSAKTGTRIAPGTSPTERFLTMDSERGKVGYWDGETGADVAAVVGRARGTRD
jgi:uncharacterized cupin superfamily protein